MDIAAASTSRTTLAPEKVREQLSSRSATYTAISWDPSFFSTDLGAGLASVPTKDGGSKVAAAWTTTAFAADTVKTDLSTGDVYDKAILDVFAAAIDRNQAGLATLTSNFPIDGTYKPRNGTFDFVLDRPGKDGDLRYVGLIEAAPAPILDILNAATGFRRHF